MQQPTRHTPTAAQTSTLPPRVIPSPLPNLYIYDHCPFCVRVRHILGLKNIKYNLIWLANDDVQTPTSLVGRKIVPIFQPSGTSGPSIPESLDICAAIDTDPRFGAAMLKPASGRTDISTWMKSVAVPMMRLVRVRNVRAPLPEFVFADARETLMRNYPLPEPSDFDENMKRSSVYIAEVESRLAELEEMIFCDAFCTEGGLSYDDIDLFPRLRALTVVKKLVLPARIRSYLEFQSRVAEVPLYDFCAM